MQSEKSLDGLSISILWGRKDKAGRWAGDFILAEKRFTFSFLSIGEDFGKGRILIWRVEHHSTQNIAGRWAGGFFLAEKRFTFAFLSIGEGFGRGRNCIGREMGESGSAVRMATQRAASAVGARCIGHRTSLRFWGQTDASWCAVPFDSGLTAEQGRHRKGKRTRSSLSQTEVGTLHPHISHLILARGIAPSQHSYPMQTAEERQWTRGRSSPASKTQRTAFAGAAFCVMHRSTARLRMRCAVRGPED